MIPTLSPFYTVDDNEIVEGFQYWKESARWPVDYIKFG